MKGATVGDYLEVMDESALESGAMTQVKVDGHDLLVARVGDAVYVADAHCPHMGGPLAKGTLEGTIVSCPWHHSEFDLSDGHVVSWTNWKGAAKSMAEMVRHPRPLRVYESKIEDGKVWVGPQKPPPGA